MCEKKLCKLIARQVLGNETQSGPVPLETQWQTPVQSRLTQQCHLKGLKEETGFGCLDRDKAETQSPGSCAATNGLEHVGHLAADASVRQQI